MSESEVGETWVCTMNFFSSPSRFKVGAFLLVLENRACPDESTLLDLETGALHKKVMWGWELYCERLC